MKFLKNYSIDVIKLKEGKHEFTFPVDGEFFSHFEIQDFLKDGNLNATVEINKLTSLMEAKFQISGTVKLICDRSLEEFDHELTTTEKVIYKYGLEEAEITEDVFMITRDTPSIQLAQLIYEFILLALPAKKIHPDYVEEMDDEDFEGEGELVYYDDGEAEEETENESSEEKPSEKNDPRWDILKKLKK
ncbi:YceD family protein [Belliella sp. DSM 111904]|uniref:YceD family protein n=1 Tax=Belliella filtrata TaxID=2923435 RepID=A0ABS9V3P0_9BACT|nr:YceD family protein [Belliella filtrata]MCH7410989.1 YceD family protein [Belliella filtrata]